MQIAPLEPGNRIQLPDEWAKALGLRGSVALDKTPEGILVRPCPQKSEPDGPKPPPRMMTFGRYPGDHSTLDDFRDAEWHGADEWDAAGGQ